MPVVMPVVCILQHLVSFKHTLTRHTHTLTHTYRHLQSVPIEFRAVKLPPDNNWPNVTKAHVVFLNPYYSPSSLSTAVCRVAQKKLSLTMAWSQSRVVFMSTCHQTFMNVCRGMSSEVLSQRDRLPAGFMSNWDYLCWTIEIKKEKKKNTQADISSADNNTQVLLLFNFPIGSFSSEMKAAGLNQNPSRDPDKIRSSRR